ncbi:MAG: RNA polymerase sigma-70 factor [Tannerellaceae bacterium]|jgi:RNA polymerase sigma-70 factor (ECF subfamily)|nr:RNA polymerase sigma-70 factor [Tannerellaceae bacterium]
MSFDSNPALNFGQFYNTYYKRFVRYAFHYVNDRQTAEDMTHDAILYYWENKKNISSGADVLGYLLLTIRNKCLNYLKHQRVENDYSKQYAELREWEIKARIMTLEEADYSAIFTKDMIDIITSSLKKLPRQTQDIFIQNRFQNKSRKEIAADMGVSLQKIDYHINKANDMLYADLKDYLPLLLIFLKTIL